MTTSTRVFYEQRHLVGESRIPSDGPALLIANHPGSLMDAALLGLLLNRPLHFFARGDIFQHPLARRLLQSLHMHPVHHHLDGRQSLSANDESFELAIDLLKAGELVLFFPEGFSHIDYSLLPFKKGSFRLALQAIEKAGLASLPIIPIGIHYSHPTATFSKVWINIGEKLETADYFSEYQAHPARAIKQLSNQSSAAIEKLVVSVEEKHATYLFDLLQIIRREPWYQQANSEQQWKLEKKISQLLPASERLIELQRNYSLFLQEKAIEDAWVAVENDTAGHRLPGWCRSLLALPGKLFYGLPLGIAQWIAHNKVTRIDFYAWILVASAGILSFFWQVFLFLVIWATLSLTAALLTLVASWLSGWIWWKLAPAIRQFQDIQRGKKIPGSTLSAIRAKRLAIIEQVKAGLF